MRETGEYGAQQIGQSGEVDVGVQLTTGAGSRHEVGEEAGVPATLGCEHLEQVGVPLRLLRHGDEEAGDRGVGSLHLARTAEHRCELVEHVCVRRRGGVELGVHRVDRLAVHGGVQLRLRREVVVQSARRDAHVVGDQAVRRGPEPVTGEPLAGSTEDPAPRLR